MISGRTTSVGAGTIDAWLVKIDSIGNIQIGTRLMAGLLMNEPMTCARLQMEDTH